MNDETIRRSFLDEIDSTPTAAFRIALRESLLERWDDEQIDAVDDRSIQIQPTTEVTLVLKPVKQPDHSRRRVGLIAAALVAVLAAGTLLVLVADDDDAGPRPAQTLPPENSVPATVAPIPTTVGPTTQTTVAPAGLSDGIIGGAALLTGEEFQHGWVNMPFSEFTLDPAVADTIPACDPYHDAIASSSRAVESSRAFTLDPDFYWQYVVVFPDDATASEWFDVVTDETFLTDCAAPLFDAQFPDTWEPMTASNLPVPPLALDGDEVSLGRTEFDFTREDGSAVHGEQLEARVRIGRIVTVIAGGDPRLQTHEDFQATVARAVERSRAALDGTVLLVPRPTTSPPLDDSEIADAVLLSGEEYQGGWTEMPQGSRMTMDRTIAETISACEPYLDVAFTTAEAHETFRWFTLDPDFYSQYVVVFPDAEAASQWFDAISDETFLTTCAAPLFDAQFPDEWVPVTASNLPVPALVLEGDEVSLGHTEFDFTRADGSAAHTEALEARIRIGRIVTVITGADPRLQTNEQFQTTVARAAQQARAALAGFVIPD